MSRPPQHRRRWSLLAVAAGATACAAPVTGGVPPPSRERLITPPHVEAGLDAVGLTHFFRGQLFRFRRQPAAAVTHLRLALLHVPEVAVVHQRLAEAWFAVGEVERGQRALRRGLERAGADPWLNLLAGELALRAKDHRVAVEHLRLAVAEPATAGSAGALLADALLWLGEVSEARAIAAALAAQRPEDSTAAVALAEVLEDHGQLSLALAEHRRARVQNPASHAAALGEARILEAEGQPGAAADSLAPLFAYAPEELGLYLVVARLARQAGRADAELYRAEAERLAGDLPEAIIDLALSELLDGLTGPALTRLRRAVAAAPESLGLRLFLADTLLRVGTAAECLTVLADRHLAGHALVYRTRALCHAAAGEVDLALEQTTFGLLAGGAQRELLFDAARYLSQHRPAEAAGAELAALAARAEIAAVDVRLAEAALADHVGDTRAVLGALAGLPPPSGEDLELELRRADLWARHGEVDAALALLHRLWREAPADPVRLNALGFTLADLGLRLDEAEVYLRRAYRLAPDQGFVTDSLGWLFHRRGDHQAALRLLLKAQRESPGEPEILAHLAAVYAALGRVDAARAAVQAALEASPPPALRRAIEQLLEQGEGR